MTDKEVSTLHDKIKKGLELSFSRLVAARAKEDGELIFAENGEIVRIKAKNLVK
jgi:hypothetical protein